MAPNNISFNDAKFHLAKLAQPFTNFKENCALEIRLIKEDAPTLSWRIRSLDPTENLDQGCGALQEAESRHHRQEERDGQTWSH